MRIRLPRLNTMKLQKHVILRKRAQKKGETAWGEVTQRKGKGKDINVGEKGNGTKAFP